MYHPLTVHIQQPPGDAFELTGAILSAASGVSGGSKVLRVQTDSHPYVPR